MTAVNHLSKILPLSTHPRQRVFLFLAFIFFLMSCAPIYIARTDEDFQTIADLERQISEEKDASLRAKGHLQLGWLYSNYKNPKVDYRKALEEFELYLSLAPEAAQTDEIQNWLSILRALEKSERKNLETRSVLEDQAKNNQQMRENIEKLSGKNAGLEEANASLRENNASLKKAMEGLKTLNLQIEKKKKSGQYNRHHRDPFPE